jgi:hypothetical protein
VLDLPSPSMGFDHDSTQVMKFVYMQSHCSVAALNETLKPRISPTENIVCSEYALEIFSVTSDKIIDVVLET